MMKCESRMDDAPQTIQEIFDINDNKSSATAIVVNEKSRDEEKPIARKKKKKRVLIKWKIRFKEAKPSKKKPSTALQTSSRKKKMDSKQKKKISKINIEMPKNETCNACGKSFLTPYNLTLHTRMAHGLLSFKCEFCEKTFKAAQYLTNHMKIHSIDKNAAVKGYICNLCNDVFSTKRAYMVHQKFHNEVKESFTCEICNKTMLLKSSLNRHMKQQHSNGTIGEKTK